MQFKPIYQNSISNIVVFEAIWNSSVNYLPVVWRLLRHLLGLMHSDSSFLSVNMSEYLADLFVYSSSLGFSVILCRLITIWLWMWSHSSCYICPHVCSKSQWPSPDYSTIVQKSLQKSLYFQYRAGHATETQCERTICACCCRFPYVCGLKWA